MKDQKSSSTPSINDSIEPRITVKMVDMENQKLRFAQKIIRDLIISGTRGEKEVASKVKKEFDETFGGTWHCIVGTSFGANVTHQENHFLYIYVEHFAVLLFKSV